MALVPPVTIIVGGHYHSPTQLDAFVDENNNEQQTWLPEEEEALVQSEQRVEELEETIRIAQWELDAKRRALKEARESWGEDKQGLMDVIATLTERLAGIEKEETEEEEAMKAKAKEQQTKLEGEIQEIQASLQRARKDLQDERDAAVEIKNRLMSAEDQLEFEQMRFEEEKKELGNQIQGEKDRLNRIENQFRDERQRFETDRTVLQEQIETEAAKLQEAESDLKRELSRFEQERNDLRQLLREQANQLSEAAKKLTDGQTKFKADKASLEKAFQEERSKLERTVNFLETEVAQFEEAKSDLEMKIVYEKGKVKDLSKQLEKEEETFRQRKEELERGIATEKANIEKVESELEQEQTRMASQRSYLRDELQDQRNLRRLQAKEMSREFSELREQLNARWQEEKRLAREERKSLTEKYEIQILEASDSVAQLEVDLKGARRSSEELQVILDEITQEKEFLISERKESEKRYKRTLKNRDGIIADLRMELDQLYDDIYDRDQTIARYENSLRQLLGLSVQLTKKRVGRVFRRREKANEI